VHCVWRFILDGLPSMVATRKRDYEPHETSSTLLRRAIRGYNKENLNQAEEAIGCAKTAKGVETGGSVSLSLHLPRSGRGVKRCRLIRRATPQQDLTGYLSLLPIEILEKVMVQCSPTQLGQLEASCKYFHAGSLIEAMAKERLKNIPRAKDLVPDRRLREKWLTLLLFVTYQSTAAAQVRWRDVAELDCHADLTLCWRHAGNSDRLRCLSLCSPASALCSRTCDQQNHAFCVHLRPR
jgi:hypothetical protein